MILRTIATATVLYGFVMASAGTVMLIDVLRYGIGLSASLGIAMMMIALGAILVSRGIALKYEVDQAGL